MDMTQEPAVKRETETGTPPVRINASGVPLVGGSRVTLASVAHHFFDQRRSPAEIVESFPTLTISDVEAAIVFYRLNREEMDRVLANLDAAAERMRAEYVAQGGNATLRAAWAAKQGQPNASPAV